jgi:hypothetical protein
VRPRLVAVLALVAGAWVAGFAGAFLVALDCRDHGDCGADALVTALLLAGVPVVGGLAVRRRPDVGLTLGAFSLPLAFVLVDPLFLLAGAMLLGAALVARPARPPARSEAKG